MIYEGIIFRQDNPQIILLSLHSGIEIMTAIKDKTELLNYIRSVDWSQFETAFGNADLDNYFYNPKKPKMETVLLQLFSDDRNLAIASSGMVGDYVCHQNCFISTAALPVCDVIIYGLKTLDDVLKEELTLTVYGLVSLIPKDQPEDTWQWEIRKKLEAEENLFLELTKSDNTEVVEYAKYILEKL